jgi:hypothetical protein
MGFAFTFDRPADGVAVGCAFNGYQMNHVRLVMIEAGAIAGDGFKAALRQPGLETAAETLPAKKFMSNNGWHIAAHEAAFIAARLRQATELGVIGDLRMFLDDRPSEAEWQGWVDEFATFNEQAAGRDGYYVS